MALGRDGAGRKHEAECVDNGTDRDGAAVAEAFGDRTEDRLPDTPGEVLDRDGEREIGPRPAKAFGDRDLEEAEARTNGEAHEEYRAGGHQKR